MEMTNFLNAKCKNCGSEMIYNPKVGCLTCKYCETNVFLPKTNEEAVLVRQYTRGFHPNQLNQALRAYRCNSCGNVYYMSSEEKSHKCPNCGNDSSTLVEDPGYCADGIVPFRLTKEEASKHLLKYLKKTGSATSKDKKDTKGEGLVGVYVPVWNFQFNVDSAYSATTTELRQYSDGTYYSVSKPLYGEKHKRIKSLDQSATSAESDEFLDLFDENDYAGIIPYTPEYTYGYKVDTINKNIHDYYYKVTEDAEKDVKGEIQKKVMSSYKEVSNLSIDCRANDVFFNFTYIPVYVHTMTKKDKTYKTYVSGTTGKVAGHNPKTPASVLGSFIKFIIFVAFIIFLIKLLGH